MEDHLRRLAMTAWVLVGVGIACVIAGMASSSSSAPPRSASGFSEGEVLGIVLFVALWIAGLVLMGIVEHMKRKYDLVTYRDILAYSRGEEPPRDGAAFARRHPVMMGWAKGIVSAIAGFVVAVVLCRIFLG